ncbi:hypothetical protein FGO68_gene6925 [Halteria grandinella]|uniref:Uncharacterized protein n=1 Tax=Halteria grandinella TaxID=5974 RepID=A0A8J8P9S4_HALGN|nr:hypothetical protein FGO68_gene6925 [Halteria grandinella]
MTPVMKEGKLAIMGALAASKAINFNSQIPLSKLVIVFLILLPQQLLLKPSLLLVDQEMLPFLGKENILMYQAHSSMLTLFIRIPKLRM